MFNRLLLACLLFVSTCGLLSPAIPEMGYAAASQEPHLRECRVLRVIDGDTCECLIELASKAELGSVLSITTSCRLYGINAPDASKEGPERARAATAYLRKLVSELPDGACQCELRGRDKYGRILCIFHGKDKTLNQQMIDAGQAVVYLP